MNRLKLLGETLTEMWTDAPFGIKIGMVFLGCIALMIVLAAIAVPDFGLVLLILLGVIGFVFALIGVISYIDDYFF